MSLLQAQDVGRKRGLTRPAHRHLPAIGRFLIVVTFLEDALRIITQWNDQLTYLKDYRHSEPIPGLSDGRELQ